MMQRIIEAYFKLLQLLLTGMIILLIIPVLLQVFSRFVGFIPRYIWTEEIARFAFIWVIMLGATVAVRERTHFSIDLLPPLHPRIERWITVILFVCMLIMALVFFFAGLQFARYGATQLSEISELPMLAIYIAWPIAGFSWFVFLAEQVHEHYRHAEKAEQSHLQS